MGIEVKTQMGRRCRDGGEGTEMGVKTEWQQTADMQVSANSQPYLGTSVPQPRQHVQEPRPADQGIDLAKGMDADIINVVDQFQAKGRASNESADAPLDPNLTCPVCRTVFRKGEIQAFSRHVKLCG